MNFCFQEIKRTLKKDGISIHLFPLRNYIFEGHLELPFVHRIYNIDKLITYIKICSFLRLGKYKKAKLLGMTIDEYSERHADYLVFETNYMSKKEIVKLTKSNQLKFSFKYTEQYYWNKIRSILGLTCKYKYQNRNVIWNSFLFSIFVRLSSITLVLEKNNKYI